MDQLPIIEEIVPSLIAEDRIHPDLRLAAANFKPGVVTAESLVAVRATPSTLKPVSSTEETSVSEHYIPRPDSSLLHVRVFNPKNSDGPRGGLLWIHGGGYVYEMMEMDDPRCVRFALEADCVVVSVDYRPAPENPYPAALEDCYLALDWFHAKCVEFEVDRERIAVAGGSAGGGLTVALCLLARDRGGPAIAFQLPLCPMIDDRHITPSSREVTDRRFWNLASNLYCWQAYLGDLPANDIPIYAAPARATDYSGLPPAYMYVGDLDMFRDETLDYASRLGQAGIPVELHVFPGCFHGFEVFADGAVSRRANDEVIRALREALSLKW